MRAKEFTQGVAEAPLPPDWDPEKIDLQQTFRDRIQYVVDRAQRIGGGSARVAFEIDYQGRPTVIKVAKNRKGLVQNKAEIGIYLKNKGRWGANRLVVPLVDYDQENSPPVWIQTERARRIQAPTLVRLLHAPDWWTFLKLVAHYRGLIKPNLMMFFKTPEDIEDDYIAKGGSAKEWEIFSGYARDLADLVKATTLEDYGHVGNWGEYQGRPVLLDLGFTDESKTAYGFKE
jgi:hypothetical protein